MGRGRRDRRGDDRPRWQSPPRRPRSPPRRDDRAYRPNGGGESYRPGRDRSPRQNGYSNRAGPGDSFRPPQGDFTFRSGNNGPSFPPTGPSNDRSGRGGRKDRGRGGRGRGRGGRWQPVHPSERALLSSSMNNLPSEPLHNPEAAAKFRDVDAMSDDDEEAMDISDQSEHESESDGPSKKRARTEAVETNGNAAPKWSNPDPYTALPCPDDTLQKKRDVVALIRKARIEEKAVDTAPKEAEDFIAFETTDEEEEGEREEDEEDEREEHRASPNAPKGPHASLPSKPPQPAPPREPPPPLPAAPPPPALPDQRDSSGPLGSRKRNANDVIKVPDYGQLKKPNMKKVNGSVLPMWEVKPGEPSAPWATVDHSGTSNVAFRLHKEVMDFYNFVRPRQFEQRIRDELIKNLQKCMMRDGRNFSDAKIHAFGSFMSGLYLPTADMDLVVCSSSFQRGGPPRYLSARSWLYKFQKLLVSQKVADPDSIEVIAHARIPLVKFVDKATALKVDVSFENLGGVEAIDTFLRWKASYPAMPILVTVIKHFLLMRGLNEPVNGGIGGFSVICLVVSMLQLMPQVQSRSLIPEHHLGEMLLEFLDLYGRQFNYEHNAISLTGRIGYMPKSDVRGFTYKNRERLSIIDPNNDANDISGGSSNVPAIMSRFEDAFLTLRDRMKEVASKNTKGGILDTIMAGDYSSFEAQRNYLRHVHEKQFGPCAD
ncbi:dna polymerase sigma subunit [Emericellopsis cladophorae]|uniref:polynucleotide adenylyltransferase n=1 Tax=Emericellopsis cladophorae TaxID=2686198 RepID=A0A9P9XZS0_9HYPO|nr:dna polymerase sigma subunit [Emericellopsis cladophorae]KAI6780661.1 dna polymerase sigma subunit [Emericellopsis cladophorae]